MGSNFHAEVADRNARGLLLRCENGVSCQVSVVRDNVIRVLFLRDSTVRQPRTWTVVNPAENDAPWDGMDRLNVTKNFPMVAPSINMTAAGAELRTEKLILEIQCSPLRLVWKTPNGRIFAADRPARPYLFAKKEYSCRHYMQRSAKDRYYGLGDKTGALNLHGRRVRTTMTDALGYDPQSGDPLYKHWPFLMTVDSATGVAYGVLYDNMADATFDLGCEHSNYHGLYRSYEAEDGDLDYYCMIGPTVADVIKTNAKLTGGMALGPRWTLGYHCTAMPLADAPNAQERIEEFLVFCQKYKIPCSAFHFGSGYTSIGAKRYVFNWNTEKFPDPKHLIGRFRQAGMRVVANLKPCLLTDHPRYDEVAQSGAFISDAETGRPSISQFWDGEGAHLDFTNRKAVQWWQEGLRKAILEYGISSAWNDNNEYELWDEDAVCAGFGRPVAIQLARPLHSLLMTRASFEEQKKFSPSERVYTVSRAGCPGIQRYAQTWSGDNTTSWASLRYNLRTGLQMGLSGMFNIGHDVGGFAGPAPEPELLVRWVQTGVLHPRFIMNSWKADGRVTTPWLHPSMLPFARGAIRLRYRLIPYLYSLYRTAARDHEPILRPTFYDFPDDARCRDENDELMLGPALLAAPVVVPGGRQRQVYLPQGPPGWYDFYTEEWFPPGEVATVAAPLDRLPLFVPAGSVIPLTAESEDFSRLHDEPSRVFRVFPANISAPAASAASRPANVGPAGQQAGSPTEFCLWEDDGITASASEADYRILRLELQSTDDQISLSVASKEGSFKLSYASICVALPAAEVRPLRLEVVQNEEEREGAIGEFELSLEKGVFRMHAL